MWRGHARFPVGLRRVGMVFDPVLFNRVGPAVAGVTFGIKRLSAAPLRCDSLPPVHAVFVSHGHFDHLDRRSLKAIFAHHRPEIIVTATNTGDLFKGLGSSMPVLEPDDGDVLDIEVNDQPLRIEALAVSHRGSRWRRDTHRKAVAYRVRSASHELLFVGDTSRCPKLLARLAEQSPVDLAMLPIGSYDPYLRHHVNPEQAMEIAGAARARCFVPHHHSTFALSREPLGEPLERLRAESLRTGIRFLDVRPGVACKFGGNLCTSYVSARR